MTYNDMRNVRHYLSLAVKAARKARDSVPMDHEAYDALDDVLDYIDPGDHEETLVWEHVVRAEKAWDEYDRAKAAEEYDAPTWRTP